MVKAQGPTRECHRSVIGSQHTNLRLGPWFTTEQRERTFAKKPRPHAVAGKAFPGLRDHGVWEWSLCGESMAALFVDILTKVTLPIITLVILGWLLQPRLKLDVGSLNRLQVYVVMPAFLIHFLSAGKQPLSEIWPVFTFGLVQFLVLIPLGWLLVVLFRMRRTLGPMMGLGTAYA